MVTHLRIRLVLRMLNFCNLPIHSHCLHFWIMLALCKCQPFQGWVNTSIRVQYKYESAMKAVRVNGKITEVKQPQYQSNSKMGDYLGSIHFVFSQWQKYQANIPNFTKQLEFPKNSIDNASIRGLQQKVPVVHKMQSPQLKVHRFNPSNKF